MTTRTSAREYVDQQLGIWNRHDAAAVAAAYAIDATIFDPAYPEPLKGRDAIQKDAGDFFTAFPDLNFKVDSVLSEGDTIAFMGRAGGTHKGPLPLPTGMIPPTNKRVDFDFCVWLSLDSTGATREEHRYYDVLGQLTQLGVMQ